MRAFGHRGDDYFFMGVNGKNSELHAAMGLCNLPMVPQLIQARKAVCDVYTELLDWSRLSAPQWADGLARNYSYYPVAVSYTHLDVYKRQRLKSKITVKV